jgi:hypothetical protein
MKEWWLARIGKLQTQKECREFEQALREQGRDDLLSLVWAREADLKPLPKNAPTPQNDFERRVVRGIRIIERMKGHPLSRTWDPLIINRGYVGAIEHTVLQKTPSSGFADALKYGLLNETFEAMVLEKPELFSDKAIRMSRERLKAVKS